MYESTLDKLEKEHKLIIKCIFKGMTIAQIADKLSCSQSTISNRMSVLYEKYNAKTKFEFALGVLGEIVRNNKKIMKQNDFEIEKLKLKLEDLTSILSKIILNKNKKESFDYWINEAQKRLL